MKSDFARLDGADGKPEKKKNAQKPTEKKSELPDPGNEITYELGSIGCAS